MSGKLHERDYMLTLTEIRSAVAAFDVDGGAPITLGGVNATDKDCFNATKFATGDKAVYVAYNPDFKYVDVEGQRVPVELQGFDGTNLAGEVISCFKPTVGVCFGVEMDNIDGGTKPTVGKYLEPKNGGLVYEIKATATADTPSFEVVDIVADRKMTGDIGQEKKEIYIVKTVYNA